MSRTTVSQGEYKDLYGPNLSFNSHLSFSKNVFLTIQSISRITIVSLARLPFKVTNFLNIVGVLLVAFLVQYNRTGIEVGTLPP